MVRNYKLPENLKILKNLFIFVANITQMASACNAWK